MKHPSVRSVQQERVRGMSERKTVGEKDGRIWKTERWSLSVHSGWEGRWGIRGKYTLVFQPEALQQERGFQWLNCKYYMTLWWRCAVWGTVWSTCNPSTIYTVIPLFVPRLRFLQLRLYLMHEFWTQFPKEQVCVGVGVCVQIYIHTHTHILCGTVPRPITSYSAWQVTNSFLIACTRKIISLFPFLGGTRQDVCAIIIASVPFSTSLLLFLEQVF